jgi:hypothetical protein
MNPKIGQIFPDFFSANKIKKLLEKNNFKDISMQFIDGKFKVVMDKVSEEQLLKIPKLLKEAGIF